MIAEGVQTVMPPVWWHPWLQVERRTRAILAHRLSFGASGTVDAVLSQVVAERRRIALAGWFNYFPVQNTGD